MLGVGMPEVLTDYWIVFHEMVGNVEHIVNSRIRESLCPSKETPQDSLLLPGGRSSIHDAHMKAILLLTHLEREGTAILGVGPISPFPETDEKAHCSFWMVV